MRVSTTLCSASPSLNDKVATSTPCPARLRIHPFCDKITVTGNKAEDKKYYRHSGYPGGIYETNFKKMQQRFPGRALETAVKGMLPKGPLGYAMLKKLKCYAGDQHPHTAQQPKALEI